MGTTADNSIPINGQLIPWSFVALVRNACGNDWDATIDCFWKARKCTGVNGIQRYIMCGLKRDANGVRYIFLPSKERKSGQMESLRQWWDGLYQRKRKPNPEDGGAELVASLSKLWGI